MLAMAGCLFGWGLRAPVRQDSLRTEAPQVAAGICQSGHKSHSHSRPRLDRLLSG